MVKMHEKGGALATSRFPESDADRAAVQQQLERILASPGFRNSRKYPAFLRYIVEHTLNGETDHLKERTLGVEVFGRETEYDTSTDPVVRIVAAEVRKRIGQYYYEIAAPGELHVDLQSGTYVPRFIMADGIASPHLVDEPAVVCEPVSTPQVLELAPVTQPHHRLQFPRMNRRAWYMVAALSLAALIGAAIWLIPPPPTAMAQFWSPILNSPGPVMMVTGGGASWIPESIPESNVLSIDEQQSKDLVALADAATLAAVAGVFRLYRKSYLIRPTRMMDLPQLRTASAVLIGALNNPWTLRLTAPLRFGFMHDGTSNTNWIQDRKKPGARDWKVVTTTPYTMVNEDWAVISRFRDPNTEHWIVTAPGLSRWGTVAAGEFLTNPIYLEELAKLGPPHWESKNIQAVIATKVINGQPGPPRILAVEFW
jgi:hypothetical protein